MKKIKSILIVSLLSLAFFSCESYVEGINDDPNRPLNADATNMLQGVMLANQFWQTGAGNRIAMIWLNQGTGSDRQYIALNNWNNITSGDFNDAWNGVYVGVATQSRIAVKKALADNNKVLAGALQVLEAHSIGTAAGLWGDIPFSEINNPKISNPKYEPQAEVYQAVQMLLNSAIANLKSGSGRIADSKDISYGGDATKWEKLANSLKARYYLRVKDYPNALTYANRGISSADDDFKAKYGLTAGRDMNPFFQFMIWNRDGYLDAEEAYGQDLLTPGSSKYRGNTKTDETARGAFNYFANSPSFKWPTWWGGEDGKFSRDADMPLVTYGEMLLIIAECEGRTDLGKGVTAYNKYRQLLGTGYSIGLNNSGYEGRALKYADYTDNDFQNNGIENKDGKTPLNAFLREVYEERYVYFIGHYESFIDFGRTNNIAEIELKSGFDGTPQRFLYPQSEINSNTNTPSPLPKVVEPTPVNK